MWHTNWNCYDVFFVFLDLEKYSHFNRMYLTFIIYFYLSFINRDRSISAHNPTNWKKVT